MMPRADYENLAVTQTCAQHIANGELPAVDVAYIQPVNVEIRSLEGVVDFTTYEPKNRGYCCGVVLDKIVLNTLDFEMWGPKGKHYPKGTFKWQDGSTSFNPEIGPCHLAALPTFKPGDRLSWGEMIGLMSYSGNVVPPGVGGTHCHLKLYAVPVGSGPTWMPYAFLNPEDLRMNLVGG
jgi:hypothetical protein